MFILSFIYIILAPVLLEGDSIDAIGAFLSRTRTLQKLIFNFDSLCTTWLTKNLIHNSTLTEMYGKFKYLNDSLVYPKLFKNEKQLIYFKLGIELTESATEDITKMLRQNTTLKKLDILSIVNPVSISDCLLHNTTLTTLSLKYIFYNK